MVVRSPADVFSPWPFEAVDKSGAGSCAHGPFIVASSSAPRGVGVPDGGGRPSSPLALIASGGLSTGHGIAAVLAAGAAAAQLGTAFLLCPEAGTSRAHREMIRHNATPTALTRAFTGRTARGISNRFLREHTDHAPSAYPEIHHLTAPMRSAARTEGDPDGFHLWAGQAYPLAQPLPAAELVHELAADARDALQTAATRIQAMG